MQKESIPIDERRQIELILQSDTLRGSEVLRHLLRFLADKTLSGQADDLKEYTVALDALQKPSTYNPKHDSTVRIQVSRLRQKLGEYYRSEGQADPLIVDIPKGRFKLMFEPRTIVEPDTPAIGAEVPPRSPQLKLTIAIAVLLVVAVVWGSYLAIRLRKIGATAMNSGEHPVSSPDIQRPWSPFFDQSRPLIVGIEDPLFVDVQVGDGIYYRDRAIDDWSKVLQTPALAGLSKLLGHPAVQPSHYYTTLGEASAAFLIGKLSAAGQQHVSLVRSSELSWEQLADNNILIVGKQTFFQAQIRATSLHPPFFQTDKGIENTNPRLGEPSFFADQYSDAPAEQGEVYALITKVPGAAAKGEFESFISNRAAGYVGALQWLTDPRSAPILIQKLSDSKGRFPKHFQIVLKVTFEDDVPTEITYVSGRSLE